MILIAVVIGSSSLGKFGHVTEKGVSLRKVSTFLIPESTEPSFLAESKVPAIQTLKSRRRLISFRLSDEEYDGLRQLSMVHGASSLSSFVRSNVCMMLKTREPWEEEVACAMREFGQQARQLHGLVEQLGHLLRGAQRNPQ